MTSGKRDFDTKSDVESLRKKGEGKRRVGRLEWDQTERRKGRLRNKKVTKFFFRDTQGE